MGNRQSQKLFMKFENLGSFGVFSSKDLYLSPKFMNLWLFEVRAVTSKKRASTVILLFLGINVHSYAVGDLSNGINCPGIMETTVPSCLQAVYTIEPYYEQVYCIEITVWTPFNGQYERISESKNGYPQYMHVNEDYICYWDEVWTFESANEDLLAIVGGTSTQLYPESFKIWAFAGSDGSFAVYDKVPVECRSNNNDFFFFAMWMCV